MGCLFKILKLFAIGAIIIFILYAAKTCGKIF